MCVKDTKHVYSKYVYGFGWRNKQADNEGMFARNTFEKEKM